MTLMTAEPIDQDALQFTPCAALCLERREIGRDEMLGKDSLDDFVCNVSLSSH